MATPAANGADCPLNEIVIIEVNNENLRNNFNRGDCDGNERINVTDAAICAQNIFFDRIRFFDCDDMLDANNDEKLDLQDPIAILNWVFLNAADLDAPFRTCGTDDDDDTLRCEQSNC